MSGHAEEKQPIRQQPAEIDCDATNDMLEQFDQALLAYKSGDKEKANQLIDRLEETAKAPLPETGTQG